MKASVRWLRELCPQLPDDAMALAHRLTSAGLEVEGTEAFGLGAEPCLVARVVSMRPHPSRSGLRLVTVDAGGGPQEIVCGAPNVPDAGGLVVLAPLGAHLPAKNMTIERRSIAGVVSEGMLCSEAELGLGDDSSGILILPAGSAAAGARMIDAFPSARDTILEIGLTPNRPDGLGHVGLAREAAALFDLPFATVRETAPGDAAAGERRSEPNDAEGVAIDIRDPEGCPHYASAVMAQVKVAPSPLEIRFRLAALGLRPISNVVDVTNLVMLEFGHPMHAFDLDTLQGPTVTVRRALDGERLRTLDGIDRTLADGDLVICDAAGPIALAGVMGGGRSEISAATRRVLLECAYFDPRVVRRAARRHGLHTDASHRFERGVDWGDTSLALASAVGLMKRVASASVGAVRRVEGKGLTARAVVLRHDRVNALLGVEVPLAEARAILGRLGFSKSDAAPSAETWNVPSFRPDVAREADLIEEIGRVRGYDAIPAVLPRVRASRDAGPRQALARRAREVAVGLGLSEAVTTAFASPRELADVGAPVAAVTLQNPLTDEASVMRTSLLPALLRTLARARRHGQSDTQVFTVGSIFFRGDGPLPEERLALCAVVVGDRAAWLRKAEPVDVWDAKGLAEALCMRISGLAPTLLAAPDDVRPKALHPRGAAVLHIAGLRVGTLGPLHPDTADAFEVDPGAVCVDLDLTALQSLGTRPIRFSPLPRFPASTRDIAIVVAESTAAGDVERVVRDAAGDLAEQVTLFDRFSGGSLPAGRASLGLHVVYRAPDRTLTDAEVDTRHALVVATVEKEFSAVLR